MSPGHVHMKVLHQKRTACHNTCVLISVMDIIVMEVAVSSHGHLLFACQCVLYQRGGGGGGGSQLTWQSCLLWSHHIQVISTSDSRCGVGSMLQWIHGRQTCDWEH